MNIFWLSVALHYYPAYVNRLVSAVYGLITVVMAAGMFMPGTYDAFLRFGRFGGGVEVAVALKNTKVITAPLFLITEKRVIMFDDANTNFIEVPAEDVETVTYALFPRWKLPPSSPGSQLRYLK